MVIGDAKEFCSAIVVPASAQTNPADIARDIEHINKNLPDYARIKKFIVARQAFSSTNQLLTDNGRLRRAAIFVAYVDGINDIYAPEPSNAHEGVVYDIF